MDLNTIRNFLAYLVKSQAPDKRELDVDEFTDLWNACSLAHFKKKVGLPEEYRPGHPVPSEVFENTMKNSMDLDPFKVYMGGEKTPLFVPSSGVADQPDDLWYPSALTYKFLQNGTVKIRPVDIVTDQEWSLRLSSSITFPTKKYPIVNFTGGKMRFAPSNLRYVEFQYLRLPQSVVYAYTFDDGFVAYDQANSTQPEWSDDNCLDIIYLMLEKIGVSISRGDLYSIANKEIKEGV